MEGAITVEQERTRYRRAYEGLRKAIEAEISSLRSKGERTGSLVHVAQAQRLEEMLEDLDARA